MGKLRPHVNRTTLLQIWLASVFGLEFINVEAPIDVAPEDNPTSEPVPDLIVLNRPSDEFSVSPCPSDLRLVVEISDTSLSFDLNTKAALYARAGIAEYWVLDIPGRRLIVHRLPVSGRYSEVTAYAETESVASLAAPESPFKVAAAFSRLAAPGGAN